VFPTKYTVSPLVAAIWSWVLIHSSCPAGSAVTEELKTLAALFTLKLAPSALGLSELSDAFWLKAPEVIGALVEFQVSLVVASTEVIFELLVEFQVLAVELIEVVAFEGMLTLMDAIVPVPVVEFRVELRLKISTVAFAEIKLEFEIGLVTVELPVLKVVQMVAFEVAFVVGIKVEFKVAFEVGIILYVVLFRVEFKLRAKLKLTVELSVVEFVVELILYVVVLYVALKVEL
jgi:hypothetical protein